MPHASKIAAALIALALSACAASDAAPPVTEPLAVTPQTQGQLATYLRAVKATRPGAFAVSPDGRNSFYTYCGDLTCFTWNYSMPALRGCQNLSGTRCLILYVRHEQRVAYKVDSTLAPGGRHGSEEQQPVDFDIHHGR